MSTETIDPAKVDWDPEPRNEILPVASPEIDWEGPLSARPPEVTVKGPRLRNEQQPIDPAKVTWDPVFTPSQKEWGRLRKAFAGNPLEIFEDAGDRARIELASGVMDDPETFRKRYALAAYYSQMRKEDFAFALANLDAFIEKFNNGKPRSVEAAYVDVATLFNPPKREHGLAMRAVYKTGEGLAAAQKTLFNAEAKLVGAVAGWGGEFRLIGDAFGEVFGFVDPEDSAVRDKDMPDRMAKDAERAYLGVYERYYAETGKWMGEEAETPPDWATNSDSFGDWVGNLFVSTVGYTPQLATQIGMIQTGGLPLLLGSIGVDKDVELDENSPEMSEAAKTLNVAGTVAVNGLLERVTLGLVNKTVSKEYIAQGVKGGLLRAARYFGWDMTKEGASEAAEEFGENIVDILTGERGDTSGWSAADYQRNLLRGVPESGMLGLTSGLPLSYGGYRNARSVFEQNMKVEETLRAEKERLSAVENPTPADENDLATVNTMLDAGNVNDRTRVARAIAFRNQMTKNAEEDAAAFGEEPPRTPEYAAVEAEAWNGATEEDIQAAVEGEQNRRVEKVLPHNPQDTVDAATELMAQFSGMELRIYDNIESVPAAVMELARKTHKNPMRMRAFVGPASLDSPFGDASGDAVYLVASNVRPADVAKTIGHEVVGHKGLRAVFGERFDQLLDTVYKQHFAEINKLAEGSYLVDMETDAGRRYVTEEFLANMADAKVKPSWWKEFLQKVKMGLRRIPGLQNLRFTDRELEAMLMRSARAVRKGKQAESRTDDVRFFVDPETEVRAVQVPDVGIDFSDTAAALEFLREHFQGMELEIKSDGRLVLITGRGIKEGLKRRGVHREALPALDRLITEAYPAGYRTADGAEKHSHLNGQHIYASLAEINGELYAARILLDDSKNDSRAHFKDITLKKIEDALYASSGEQVAGSLPAASSTENAMPSSSEKSAGFLDASSVINIKRLIELVNPETDVNQENSDGIRFNVAPPTESEAFKRWFGDSKAVDENGKPLVVYHGTNADFTVFDRNLIGRNSGLSLFGNGFYFTDNQATAQAYAGQATGANVKAVYLRMRNPLEIKGETLNEIERFAREHLTASHDGAVFKTSKGTVYAVFDPAQIKSATDNVGTFDPENPDIRFSVAGFSEAERRDIVAILKPFVGMDFTRPDADYAAYLAKHGVEVNEGEAHMFAVLALRENEEAADTRKKKRRDDWIYENVTMFREAADLAGSRDFKIVLPPGMSTDGMKGTFWAKDGKSRKSGVPLRAIADAIAGKTGENPDQAADKIIEFYRDLQIPDLHRLYSDWKRQTVLADKKLEERARKAYPEEKYRELLDYVERLQKSLEAEKTATANVLRLQRDAVAFAEKNLEKEYRSEFTRRILNLLNYSTVITKKYPDGRRMAEFRQLFDEIVNRQMETRKSSLLERLDRRLDQLGTRVDAGRKVKGIRDIETQGQLDRIIKLARMPEEQILAEIDEKQAMLDIARQNGEETASLEYDIALAEMFRGLKDRPVPDVEAALELVESLARDGKNALLAKINARAAKDSSVREEVVTLSNGGKRPLSWAERRALQSKRERRWKKLRDMSENFWNSLNLWATFDTMSLATAEDPRSTILYQFAQATHTAARDKDTRNRSDARDLADEIDRIWKSSGGRARSELIRTLRKKVEKTGVFRDVPDPDQKHFDYQYVSVPEARQMLAEYDSGRGPLRSYEAEAVRHQLETIGKKVKRERREEFFDGVTDRMMKLAEESEGKAGEPSVVIPQVRYSGTRSELAMTQLEGLFLRLLWQQRNIRYKMEFNGYSEGTMAQLDTFLTSETKQLGDWMVVQLERDRDGIDRVYQQIYLAVFPHEDLYFPSVFESKRTRIDGSAVDITQEGAGAKPANFTPGALKTRVFHLMEPKIADAMTVFVNHRFQMNHFVTHAETARQLRATFLHPDVKQALIDEHGEEMYRALLGSIRDFINGGNIDAERNSLFQMLHGGFVRSAMAYNLTTGAKQTMGALTYALEIPPHALATGIADFWLHPAESIRVLASTDYVKNRWASGPNADMRLLLDATGRDAGRFAAFMGKMDTLSSLSLRAGDATAVLMGGWAVYRYHKNKLLKSGVPPLEAERRALLEFEMATERTQQSGQVHMQNKAQRGADMNRLFTVFLSSQILIYQHFGARFYVAAKYGRADLALKGARGLAVGAIASAAMTAADQMLRNGVDFDDWEWWDFFLNSIGDMIVGFPVLGPALAQASKLASTGYGGSVPFVDSLAKAIRSGYTVGTGDVEWDEDMSRHVVNLLQAFGFVFTPAAHAGAVGREARKWWRIFGND